MVGSLSFRRATVRLLAVLGAVALLASSVPDGVAWGQTGHEEAGCPEAPFTDRDEIAAVHRANVDCASSLGIVAGFDDGRYRPATGVRRDQLASILFRALLEAGADLPPADAERFGDVPAGSAHDEAIHRLKAAGVAQGAGAGSTFGSGALVRRDQLVSFLARGIEYAVPGTIELDRQAPTRFADVPASNVHSGNVEATADLGIVQGFAEQRFRPAASTRRDQLATFVVRLLHGLGGDEPGPEATLALQLSRSVAEPDETVTATATLEQGGHPVEGVAVGFAVSGGAPDPSSATATTGADGEAVFAFSSSATGIVTVHATADHEGGTLTGQAQVAFSTGAPQDQFTLTLDAASVQAGDTVTATATITTAGGAPVSGRPVQFGTTGAATEPGSASEATAAGQVQFTFTATEPGTVTVTARALLNPFHEHVTRTATVTVH